jgi:hypothetical protein
MKIHIEGLGIRNAKTESSQVIWFLSQKSKQMTPRLRTSYFLTLKENLTNRLLENECILAFINKMVTSDQEQRRKKAIEKQMQVAELEMIEFKKRSSDIASKIRLKKLFDFYNTPN